MSDPKAFNCPSCGAPLTVTGAEVEIICKFCGTHVLVPEELRSKPEPSVAPQPIVQPQVVVVTPYAGRQSEYRPRRSGCNSLAYTLLALLIVIAYAIARNQGLTNVLIGSINNAVGASNAVSARSAALVSGDIGSAPGQFNTMSHFAIDPAGNFYVSETQAFRIQKFDANGKYVASWNLDRGKAPTGPNAVAADGAGNVYVILDYAILKYDGSSGKLLGKFTGNRDQNNVGDHFVNLALTADGLLWTFTWNGDLIRMDPQGKILDRIAKPFSSETEADYTTDTWESRLAISKTGNLYVLVGDSFHPRVFVLSPDGKKLINKFGDGGDTPGTFTRPLDIAVDSQDRVYISEFKRVQVLDSQGRYLKDLALNQGSVPSPDAMQYNGKGSLFVLIDFNQIFKYDVSGTAAQ